VERELDSMGFEVHAVGDGASALRCVQQREFDVVLLDIRMPGMDGVETLKQIRAENPLTEVVVLTGHGTIDVAVHCMKLGAYDFLTKPCQLEELQSIIQKAREKGRLARDNALLRRHLTSGENDDEIIGRSDKLHALIELVDRVAPTDSSVLILGESGVGKELVAHALHRRSRRHKGAFVVVDCTALQEELLHSELFGHERGAFTGANALKHGLFEVADEGTIFIDEIGELPSALQTKLLRVLETGTFRRLGGVKDIHVDARIVVATNRDLSQMVEESRFREDLFYRINVLTIVVPPLRERRADIALLAKTFAARGTGGRSGKTISHEATALLRGYDWPGNVRELQNVIERGLILCRGDEIGIEDLPGNVRLNPRTIGRSASMPFPTLGELEKSYITTLLDELKGSRKDVARALSMSERTLYRKLRHHGIG